MQAAVPAHPYAAGLIIAMVSSFLSMGKSKLSAPEMSKCQPHQLEHRQRQWHQKQTLSSLKASTLTLVSVRGTEGIQGKENKSTQEVDRVSSPSCRAPVAFFLLAAALVHGRPEYTQPTGQEMIPQGSHRLPFPSPGLKYSGLHPSLAALGCLLLICCQAA